MMIVELIEGENRNMMCSDTTYDGAKSCVAMRWEYPVLMSVGGCYILCRTSQTRLIGSKSNGWSNLVEGQWIN